MCIYLKLSTVWMEYSLSDGDTDRSRYAVDIVGNEESGFSSIKQHPYSLDSVVCMLVIT